MNKATSKAPGMPEHEQALDVYLDDLLADVETLAESPSFDVEVVEETEPMVARQSAPQPVAPKPVAPDMPVHIAPVEIPEAAPEPEPAPVVVAEPVKEPEPEPEPPKPAKPDWAEVEFQSLLFEVDGLKLAVPLIELNGIAKLEDKTITPVPHQPSWFLGLYGYREQQAGILDIAQMIMPERTSVRSVEAGSYKPEHAIFIGDARYGIACDRIHEVVTLLPDDVSWRTDRGKRPWLAGTVKKQMCALVDVKGYVDMVDEGRKAKRRPG